MLEELQAQIETQGSARARRYRLLKLILFGPVTHPGMNLLVIVSHRALAEMSAFWDEAEERVAQDRQVKCPVTLIVHTLPDVNRCLKDGAPFFCEIINQGILAYEDSEPGKDGHPKNILAKPIDPNRQRAFGLGMELHSDWRNAAEQALFLGKVSIEQGEEWNRRSAFQLNQAAESAYRMFLLTATRYAPASHNLGKLRSLARAVDPRIDEAWAPLQKLYNRHFELLQRAYVEARYSPSYETNADILAWQADRIEVLISLADALCLEHLDRLEAGRGEQNCMSSRTLVSSGDDR
ncbi:HEPN domain-containing protein [Hyphomonas oceanitis]|mgnify:FL=1|uniref:Putative nucleotidyltransferase n=1 Tax=Hyphomonas oceanitis SCH89 TaxID=1280953 RepID=A0A059G1Z5_9PROT|nr:HEPN domain-containing protein [Hyphomonas oceanitis]KDA00759.1 putative nucleotidyltransferase [Hyphomonas oceanitis SCH89]|tara:strand:- start:5750 stop:6631 length:882 start_codon:yes stop_codon:yes gene_type:complete